jgi:hypothetical protein
MSPESPAVPVKPWSDEELSKTIENFVGTGLDAGLPDVDRFRGGVPSTVDNARRKSISNESGIAVFLLQPDGPPKEFQESSNRVPMLDRGREPLTGRLWFVSPTVTFGHWLPMEFEKDDDVFRHVTDRMGLGGVPAVLYDCRDSDVQLRFYADGMGDLESMEILRMPHTPITMDSIFSAIDRIYSHDLVTPGAQGAIHLWADTTRGHVSTMAEALVGKVLQTGLHMCFSRCRILVEQKQSSGRLDIEVEEPDPNSPSLARSHAILELKVLRDLRESGTTVSLQATKSSITKGVNQAFAYRDEKGSSGAALCCFDMRLSHSGRSCFIHAEDTARILNVSLGVWHIFTSADAYRNHLAAMALTATTASEVSTTEFDSAS